MILFSPFTVGLLITLLVTYVAIDYYSHIDDDLSHDERSLRSLIHEIHDKTVDWRMLNRGIAKGSDRIAILAIDDESIRLEGRWPWPRDKTARLIDRALVNYGAKLMTFDMNFSEPDNASALPVLTRLSEQTKDSSDANLKGLLSTEIAKADADAVLANSIDASRDQIILGAFSIEDGNFKPYQDLCSEAHFERSYAGRYWSTEIVKPTVIDTPMNRLSFPKNEIAGNLKSYFDTLESLNAIDWFEANSNATDRISKRLLASGITIDPALYPYLLSANINNDYRAGQDLLGDTPQYKNNNSLKAIFAFINQSLSEKEIATLRSGLFKASLSYCSRFWTETDELRSASLFRDQNRNMPIEAANQLFASNSWESVWAQAKPADNVAEKDKEKSEDGINRLKASIEPILIPQKDRWEVNIPAIEGDKSHTGYFDAVLDLDGTVRKNALLRRDGLSYVSSIAFKTYLVDQKLTTQAVVDMENGAGSSGGIDKGNSQGISLGRVFKSLETLDSDAKTVLKIPVDKKGQLQINYSGPSYMFPYASATDVLSDSRDLTITERIKNSKTGIWEPIIHKVDKAAFLKGKILFLGATAVGIYDLRVTPFEENLPGVETHANALSNLLIETARARGEKIATDAPGFLRRSPLEEMTMWLYLLVGGIALSALLTYFGSVAGLGITILFLAAVYFIDTYVLFKSGIIVTTLFPVSLIVFDFVGLTSFKYFTEERKKRELKGTFEKYVSPAIVNEILADPENIELGGKKMELTVMFSDVRGFTTISEKLEPRALSDLLNSYLTPMTNLVFANKGTLDKYMGDAIMAFWGAPVHFKDHAKHAARCALQMLVKLKELQAEYRAKGLPEIEIGIGLNTGEMNVGNMGSDTVRSYTVMGDAVNLGSRLEGINKQYGTRIIISEFTFSEIKDEFICREIDRVKVKGKAQPVRIYELVAESDNKRVADSANKRVADSANKLAVSAAKISVLSLFAEGLKLYNEQKFREAIERFTLALSFDANDAPSQLYVERCEDYLATPPPPDWDGVFTMTSK